MCNTGNLQKGLRRRLLVAILGLMTVAPSTAWAVGYTVYVPAPNAVDDTANLQAALDACVAQGRGCTVQLATGNYLTRQLVAYNFRGTFKGTGKNKTIVEALPNLPVTACFDFENCEWWPPDTASHIWPDLIIFVDGDIKVSDLTIRATAVPATEPYTMVGWELRALISAIRVMGQSRTTASIERVAIEGMPDDSETGFWGYNLANGIAFVGELPLPRHLPQDFYLFRGTLSVSGSSFRNSASGVYPGLVKDGRITIGGSPSKGNVFENIAAGIDLESIENSLVEVSHNAATGMFASMWAVPWWDRIPTKPSLFLIHDNKFRPTGPYADGIILLDDPTNKWIYALIYNNTVEAQDIGYGGISVYNTKGTTIWNNTVAGNGADGIGLWGTTYSAVLGNSVRDFTPAPDLAQIVLDADTSHSTVVCRTSSDNAMNLGTSNKLIGCQEVGSNAEAFKISPGPSRMNAEPRILRRRPLAH